MNVSKEVLDRKIVAPSEKLAEVLVERIRLARTKDVWLGDLDLRGVLFDSVPLRNVSFAGADLSKTIFCGCKMWPENLRGARELVGARFCDCGTLFCDGVFEDYGRSLCWELPCQLSNEWISVGNVFSCETIIAPFEIEGEFFGYKYLVGLYEDDFPLLVAKLRIPADARRVCFKETKCRASEVAVEEIRRLDNGEPFPVGESPLADEALEYRVGETVVADSFDSSYKECSHGIHFFLTEKEAIDYATR